MSAYAFLNRALDRLSSDSELGAEIVMLVDKAREEYGITIALQSDNLKIKWSVDDSSMPS